MTPRLNYWNIAVLGLSQVGVIVAGVLGAGVAFKYWDFTGLTMPWATRFGVDYGIVALIIPVIWMTTALVVQYRNRNYDAPEVATYCSGWLVLFFLLLATLKAIWPFIKLTFYACGSFSN